jgi:DNA-directed RNA polymerase specialized sigma24 family protein
MTVTDSKTTGAAAEDARFQTTHWSMVLGARASDSEAASRALARLCQIYWYPLYVFVRRQGQTAEDAQDLVQGFFAKALEKDYFRQAEQEKGKFRSFLLLALKRYMANEWAKANRLKRGGCQETLSFDVTETETRYREEPADTETPEKAYERRWAETLLEQVVERLETEFSALGKARVFEKLQPLLGGDRTDRSYADVGRT